MNDKAALFPTKGWVVVGKGRCVWCDKVKSLLHDRHIDFLYIDALEEKGVRDFLIGQNLMTIPQVYFDGDRIGGYEHTLAYLENFKNGK